MGCFIGSPLFRYVWGEAIHLSYCIRVVFLVFLGGFGFMIRFLVVSCGLMFMESWFMYLDRNHRWGSFWCVVELLWRHSFGIGLGCFFAGLMLMWT